MWPLKDYKGLTLIELVVMVAIIAILSSICVPIYLNLQNQAKQGTQIGLASSLADAINLYNADPTRSKITTAAWSTQAQVDSALGDLTVYFSSESDIAAAVSRITIQPTGYIATVNPAIS